MNKTLIVLILAVIVLSWNFVFTSDKKVDLTDQAKVLQGVSLSIKYKAAVTKYWREQGKLPDAAMWKNMYKDKEVDVSKSLVDKIEVGVEGPGVISIYFLNKETNKIEKDINGKIVILKPFVMDKKLDWLCTGNLQQDLLPKRCKYIQSQD